MNNDRIINDRLADGSERPIMTGEMIAEARVEEDAVRILTAGIEAFPEYWKNVDDIDNARSLVAALRAAGFKIVRAEGDA